MVLEVTEQPRYGLKANERDQLASELQKIYDSEIHVTIRTVGNTILVALGTEFTGLEAKALVNSASEVLPRLQKLIHKHSFRSKYDVERLGGTFTEEMSEIK